MEPDALGEMILLSSSRIAHFFLIGWMREFHENVLGFKPLNRSSRRESAQTFPASRKSGLTSAATRSMGRIGERMMNVIAAGLRQPVIFELKVPTARPNGARLCRRPAAAR